MYQKINKKNNSYEDFSIDINKLPPIKRKDKNDNEHNNNNPIWDITVSEEGDFIAYTASEGIGAFTLK